MRPKWFKITKTHYFQDTSWTKLHTQILTKFNLSQRKCDFHDKEYTLCVKYFHTQCELCYSDHSGRGVGVDHEYGKKSEKMRFYKTCHTLTTIQPRKKMQLTKVVSPPKRFCGPLEARCANRIFCLKNQPLRPLGVSLRGGLGASDADFLGKKCD